MRKSERPGAAAWDAATDTSERWRATSLQDLLAARDAYHVHLVRQPHVVATAVGRYLARVEDDDVPRTLAERLAKPPGTSPPKTLSNSAVEPDAWPCVLVFVDAWMDAEQIRAAPDEMVPRRLFLPDNRWVPTCVVAVEPDDRAPDGDQHLSFPSTLVGGGYVCLSEIQGRQHVGSLGCLVSDGLRTFLLTNRHVAGEPGNPLATMIDKTSVPIGRAAARSAGRIPFTDAYPGFPGERVELAVDAGLIEVEDVRDCTTQVFGVGTLSDMVDIGPESLSLDLVGAPVRAFGAASGALTGQVVALFYRYAVRSGVEQVADAIVGPRPGEGPLRTRPGDSGTVWALEPAGGADASGGTAPPVQPLALQWGADRFATSAASGVSPYALVTFMSTVCRALDVEPVYDWNAGHKLYWGEVGHYAIGARACDLADPPALRDFFVANRERISFDLDAIVSGDFHTGDGTLFFPLADVPDRVWKQRKKGIGRPHEGPNHFADMDDPDTAGATLMSLFEQDPASVSPQAWIDFYTAKGMTARNMGLVPFRVAQLYRTTVASLKAGDVDAALTAAGVMAHYVGDACQPLHASRLHDGRTPAEEGVHTGYETTMVTSRRAKIIAGLDTALAGAPPRPHVKGHEAAALAVTALMKRTFDRLSPETICDAWAQTHHVEELWAQLGEPTIACMADGCETLAGLWSSAWAEAGAAPPPAQARDQDALKARYMDPAFAPSLFLTELADPAVLPWSAPGADGRAPASSRATPAGPTATRSATGSAREPLP